MRLLPIVLAVLTWLMIVLVYSSGRAPTMWNVFILCAWIVVAEVKVWWMGRDSRVIQ